MFVGTGSDVGKSVINAAFCRIFLQDGYQPAPFKAQNMSLNSYATPDGLEIGRAQAVQAEACAISCCVEMNPILLKPTNNTSAQVVLNGKPAGNKSASEYFNDTNRDELFAEAMESFDTLQCRYNPVVIEGAGSISEINLWDKDIVNMRVAMYANADTYLIADIDRGGVFGSVYGTLMLLPPHQRDLIKGIIINKFRGDLSLFAEGKTMLEKLTGKPVVGIIPYFRDITIEQEDSVVLDNYSTKAQPSKLNIAVVLLKHMSNFTDFNSFEHIAEVHLYYTADCKELMLADIVIIPGSKNTIADMQHLRDMGLSDTILAMHQAGKSVYGICGGYQMMGKIINDPLHVEGDVDSIAGIGILPVETTLMDEKKTKQCRFRFLNVQGIHRGYEIHMGVTQVDVPQPLCTIHNSESDGYFLNPKTWGTYIHGIFDNQEIIEYVLNQVNTQMSVAIDYHAFKDRQYDKLADLVRQCVDMKYIYENLKD